MDRFDAKKMAEGLLDKPDKKSFDKLKKQVETMDTVIKELERRVSNLEK
ncbi:hypothetical protein ACIQWI_21575 [Peribacillus frigoritolerans]